MEEVQTLRTLLASARKKAAEDSQQLLARVADLEQRLSVATGELDAKNDHLVILQSALRLQTAVRMFFSRLPALPLYATADVFRCLAVGGARGGSRPGSGARSCFFLFISFTR